MFGYIVAHQPELKFREFDRYHAYYCGVCRDLRDNYGIAGQMTLSYDLTFLAILLSGLYEPDGAYMKIRCALHPFKGMFSYRNIFTAYAADMNILLAYHKALDDKHDDGKLSAVAVSGILRGAYRKIEQKYPEICNITAENLASLSSLEKAGSEDIDAVANLFGEIFGSVFRFRDDEWAKKLYELGFFLGKYVYLLDAYDDIEDDIKKNNYNPLKNKWNSDRAAFDDYSENMLRIMISECVKRFEALPVVIDSEILRNILYAGVWSRFIEVKEKREEKLEQPL